MTSNDKKQFIKKEIDYSTTLGEIGLDMKEFALRCDKTGDGVLGMRFDATRKLLEAAVINLDEISRQLHEEEARNAA